MTVTEYEPPTLSVIDELVFPLFHEYVKVPLPFCAHAVNVKLTAGAVQSNSLISTLGLGFTVTVASAEQPFTPAGETTTAVSVLVAVPVKPGTTLRVQLNSPAPRVKAGQAEIPAATFFSHPPAPVGEVTQAPPLLGLMQKSSLGLPGVPLSSQSFTCNAEPPAMLFTWLVYVMLLAFVCAQSENWHSDVGVTDLWHSIPQGANA